VNRRGTSVGIVRYVVEASGHVEVLIPYRLYRRMLRFIRRHHMQATPDEVVADAVRTYFQRPRGRPVTGPRLRKR
jgi:hypothetical protein